MLSFSKCRFFCSGLGCGAGSPVLVAQQHAVRGECLRGLAERIGFMIFCSAVKMN